jgi:hypothetical protein
VHQSLRHRENSYLHGPMPCKAYGVIVAADDATVSCSYKRRMYHAAKLPTGRTANNMQSNPTVM